MVSSSLPSCGRADASLLCYLSMIIGIVLRDTLSGDERVEQDTLYRLHARVAVVASARSISFAPPRAGGSGVVNVHTHLRAIHAGALISQKHGHFTLRQTGAFILFCGVPLLCS